MLRPIGYHDTRPRDEVTKMTMTRKASKLDQHQHNRLSRYGATYTSSTATACFPTPGKPLMRMSAPGMVVGEECFPSVRKEGGKSAEAG
jgi:hypothetical protein